MGRFVYGPSSFVGTFLVGLAVVATASYLSSVSRIDRYLLGQECIEARDAAGTDALADEWAVYQALIKEEGLNASHILITDDSLSFGSSTDDYSPIIPSAAAVANTDYREKNRMEYSLSGLFASKGASFITRAELQNLPERDFWNAFHLSHPLTSGVLALSRVGFNHDRTEAIVSFGFSCGSLCGHSATWKFSKIGGEWQKTGTSGFEFYS